MCFYNVHTQQTTELIKKVNPYSNRVTDLRRLITTVIQIDRAHTQHKSP